MMNRIGYLIAFGMIIIAAKAAIKRQRVLILEQAPNVDLFSPQVGWRLSEWETVDDRVRGGSSFSYLKFNNQSGEGVVFCGDLDTSTLGGAGFASQRIFFNRYMDFSNYTHLKITLSKKSTETLSLNLYNSYSADRGDGRAKSQVVYKASFPLGKEEEIYLGWADFKPNYRGRDDPTAAPLNLHQIAGLSIMMQSFFDSQRGPFSIGIKSISLGRLEKGYRK